MKKLILLLLFFVLLVIPVKTNAGTTFYDGKTMFFENSDLKFWVTVKKFRVEVAGGESFGMLLKAEYETGSVEALENYGFVMFIRGCKFSSAKDKDGVVCKLVDVYKPHFDSIVPFCFPDWTIDSLDTDPLFNSYVGGNRIYYYRWLDGDKETIYGREKPKEPRLYVADHPGGTAFIVNGIAHNISLEIKACLYKMADIPRKTDQKDIDFAKPIHCFSFINSFVYNHDIGRFESPKALDKFCLE